MTIKQISIKAREALAQEVARISAETGGQPEEILMLRAARNLLAREKATGRPIFDRTNSGDLLAIVLAEMD